MFVRVLQRNKLIEYTLYFPSYPLTYLSVHHLYTINLQTEIQLVQQWFSTNRKFKNPVVVQFMSLGISAGLQYVLESKEIGSNVHEEMNLPVKARKRKQRDGFSFPCSLYRVLPRCGKRTKVHHPTSKDSDKRWIFLLQKVQLIKFIQVYSLACVLVNY